MGDALPDAAIAGVGEAGEDQQENDPTEAGREDNTGTLVPPGEDGAGIDPTDSNVMESFDI